MIADNQCSYGNFGIEASGSNLVIERNVLRYHGVERAWSWPAGFYSSLQEGGDLRDVTLRYNVIDGAVNGIHIWSPDDPATGLPYKRENFRFYNNTVYDCANSGVLLTASLSGQFKNNLVWCPDATGHLFRVDRVIAGQSFTSDYNLLGPYRSGEYRYSWLGTSYTTFSSYKTASGQDGHSINNDPLFANAANHDFRLQSASPAVNAGANVGLFKDIEGHPVPQGGAPDIGAFESF